MDPYRPIGTEPRRDTPEVRSRGYRKENNVSNSKQRQLRLDNPGAASGPTAKLVSASKNQSKNWVFEKLEDRHMMAADFQGFNDPYFVFQWPLLNTGGPNIGDQRLQDIRGVAGEDINVLPAWQRGYTGDDIKVAIVSTGVQTDHPDLEANISATLGYDAISGQDLTLFPNAGQANLGAAAEAEGTALAGLVGAVANNNEGIVGVAYESELVPIKLTSVGGGLNSDGIPDQALADLFRFENQEIDIYLHGWGPDDDSRIAKVVSEQEIDALRESALLGRDGLGNIHIFQGGDGAGAGVGAPTGPTEITARDFAGYNGYINSRYTIGVSATDHDGETANTDGTLTRYAETGPAILVSAPSGSFSGFGVINEPGIGSGVWTTDFAPNVNSPGSEQFQGFNAPTDEDLREPNDLVLNPFTGLTINDRFEDPDYTSRFDGTGAAAAHVAGVVALMLEADKEANGGVATLSYRDVQEILVRSARQNAPFEKLQTGEDKGDEFEHPETWIVNRDEIFHDVDSYVLNTDLLPSVGIFGELYNPIIDPSSDHSSRDFGGGVERSNVSLYTNGAGYTVSQGRTFQGAAVGYGHGVVDAELAVKLAEQWNSKGQTLNTEESFTTFTQPGGGNLPAVEVGNNMIGFLVVPGRLGGGGGHIPFYNEYAVDNPFSPGPNYTDGSSLSLTVPEDRSLQVEWVEARLSFANPDIDNLRITLISPNGVHSELNDHFDTITGSDTPQYGLDPVNPGGLHEFGGTGPGGTGTSTGGVFDFTFSTNRHWGERTNPVVQIDPATGEPYRTSGIVDEFGNTIEAPTTGTWELLIENFGPTANALITHEITWHGTPIEETTRRIQGFVGIDEFQVDENDIDGDGDVEELIQDGAFNFDRYIQTYTDLFPAESLVSNGAQFNRLGEVERFADETQEAFAENVTVELLQRTQADVDAGAVGTVIDQFVTGDDGNYYFDVVPPVSTRVDNTFDIEVVFQGGLSESQRAAFETAAERWESIITADLPDVITDEGIFIDDLVIAAEGVLIDGVGGILGGAAPSTFREDTMLPAAGGMQFDSADLVQLEADGQLLDVILHEMGHVLGIGSIWEQLGLVVGADTVDPRFIGPQAVAEFNSVFGANETGVPIEGDPNTGPGTRDGHWSELVFDNELMTGFINPPGEVIPLSSVTIAQLADLGYTVDISQADPYTPPAFPPANFPPTPPPAPIGAPIGAPILGGGASGGINLHEVMLRPDIEPIMVSTVNSGGGGGAGGGGGEVLPTDVVEYVVRIADGEGRGNAKEDLNAPDGFQQKYKNEWTITEEYFRAYDHEGRAPDYERDAVTGEIIPDAFNPTVPATLIGSTTFNPATDYSIRVDNNGTILDRSDDVPIPFQAVNSLSPGLTGLTAASGQIIDNVRGVNFLLDPAPEISDPAFTNVTLEGFVFNDKDESGAFDGEDVALGNVTVFVDANANGDFDPGEQSVLTSNDPFNPGQYSFTFENVTTTQFLQLGVVEPAGFNLGTPIDGVLNVLISPGDGTRSGFDFALVPEIDPDPDPGPDPDPDPGPDPSTFPGRLGGVVFNDSNNDGTRQGTEGGVQGVRVYIDADNDLEFDADELFAISNQFGAYDLSNIPPGNINVRIDVQSPLGQTAPAGDQFVIDLLPDGNVQGLLFGVRNLATRDFGDLPSSAGFPTSLADNGASHEIKPGNFLGTLIDGEVDGQPNVFATGDDLDGAPNDDDGVVLNLVDTNGDSLISAGEALNFEITVSGIGQSLHAWIDFNGDGDWLDEGERLFDVGGVDVNPGVNTTGNADPNLDIPAVIAPAGTSSTKVLAARFRLGPSGLGFAGPADSGEVEDYLYNSQNLTASTTLPGDYDLDGDVDSADYQTYRIAFGMTGPNPADGNGDGVVNSIDYAIWRENLGATSAAAATAGGGGSAAPQVLLSGPSSNPAEAARIETELATYNFDSFLATAGLQQQVEGEGDDAVTVIRAVSSADIPAAAALLQSIGIPTEPIAQASLASSSAVAAADAAQLDLALELAIADADDDEAPLDLLPGESQEEQEEALALALEDELLAY